MKTNYNKQDVWGQARKKNKCVGNKWISTGIVGIVTLLTWGLTLFAKEHSRGIEKIYSSWIYPRIAKSLGVVMGLFPVSIGEMLVMTLMMGILITGVWLLINPVGFLSNIKIVFHWGIRIGGVLYILFYILWGFNYYREDYIDITGMTKEAAAEGELNQLCREVIIKANKVRESLTEDDEGVFIIKDGFGKLSKQAQVGFDDFKVGSLDLGGKYGRAKPLVISKWMSYTGITGIYFPYTSEPNVNKDIPDAIIPVTMSHEMAHQRGFAKEDEANFIAYQSCVRNPDKQFQYSGYYLALKYLMSDLYKIDRGAYEQVAHMISDGVKRDMNYEYHYWRSREGKVEKAATTMNDNYLKANNQAKGVESYNGVVELLMAEYKSKLNSD